MWLKRILISIGILAAVGAGSFILYNVAYTVGDADGYDNGYSAGQKVGYIEGKQDGYDDGYTVGRDEGYDEGQADGYADGYTAGAEAGAGHGYSLRDPTYAEAVAFLSSDRTDGNRYDDDTYVCSHFARDVCNNAEAEGLRCAFVELRYSYSGHSIVAFDTIDRGLVYFEPRFDDEVRVEVGRSYAQLNHYLTPSYDDWILDILVIW